MKGSIIEEKAPRKKLRQLLMKRVTHDALRFSGLTFIHTKTESELEQVYRLRYHLYSEAGYICPSKYPDGVFKDQWDHASINFLVLNSQEEPIGTMRLVLNSIAGFPTEQLFNFKIPRIPRHRIAEISRFAIAKNYRAKNHTILIGLIKLIYEYSKDLDIEVLYAYMPEALEILLRKLEISFIKLPTMPLTPKYFSARDVIGGYFKRHNHVYPYLLSVMNEKILLGLDDLKKR